MRKYFLDKILEFCCVAVPCTLYDSYMHIKNGQPLILNVSISDDAIVPLQWKVWKPVSKKLPLFIAAAPY